jgi:inorganic pyrophosphatase
MQLHRLPAREKGAKTFNVVIETARGSRNKYSFDPELGAFVLKKVLAEGHVFPFDFGFVPRTKAEDGDPVDVLVLMDEPGIAGCLVECRVIGCLQARQTKEGKWLRTTAFSRWRRAH